MSEQSEKEVSQDQIEVHWQHPRTKIENPVLLIWPNPTREEWAAEKVDVDTAVVVCRTVLYRDNDDEIQKHAERVDPLDEIPAYIEEALLNYDSNYGPVDHVVNPVNESDTEPPEDVTRTFDDYFTEAES